MHVEVRDLLLGVDCHVLVLLYLHLLVDFEDGLVVEVQVDVLEREDGLHGHEERDAGLDRKARMLLRQGILDQELVELPDLLAAEGQNVDERHELLDVEWVGL